MNSHINREIDNFCSFLCLPEIINSNHLDIAPYNRKFKDVLTHY